MRRILTVKTRGFSPKVVTGVLPIRLILKILPDPKVLNLGKYGSSVLQGRAGFPIASIVPQQNVVPSFLADKETSQRLFATATTEEAFVVITNKALHVTS